MTNQQLADWLKNKMKDVIQQVNLGDGGCIAKALYNDKTATDAPLIILNADTFTNADITRAYKAFLDHLYNIYHNLLF